MCITLQVRELKGHWLLFPLSSLFKPHRCSQEKTKQNPVGRVCSLKKDSLGTVVSISSFLEKPVRFTSMFCHTADVVVGEGALALQSVPTPLPLVENTQSKHHRSIHLTLTPTRQSHWLQQKVDSHREQKL